MGRVWLAIAAAAAAVAVLGLLIYQSRPVSGPVSNAHYARIASLDQSMDSFTSLLAQMRAARRDGAGAGTGVDYLRGRLEAARDRLALARQAGGNDAGPWANYKTAVDRVLSQAENASRDLERMARGLGTLRENGPDAVRRLREVGAGPDPDRFFQFLLRTLDYARPGSNVDAASLEDAVSTLSADTGLPGDIRSLTEAARTVLDLRDAVDENIGGMAASDLVPAALALARNYEAGYMQRIQRAENARILVSVYSLMLLLGLAFLGARLHRSYRELNDVNTQLSLANENLEQRVRQRTSELEQAFNDLKESQVQLVQAEKMASLGQLVAGISHEINTPLLYLQSNATLINETLTRVGEFVEDCHDKLIPRIGEDEDRARAVQRYVAGLQSLRRHLEDGEIRDDLEEVMGLTNDNLEGLEELTTLAQGLKDFSRLDRAPVDTFDVNEGIEKTLLIARNLLKNRIRVHKDLGDVPRIRCSPSQINQVVLNLVSNASQAIKRQGDIRISTARSGDFVTIRVEDNGVGIAADVMDKVRDPFFTTKEPGAGTGLGLSIVSEILRSHDGRLEIESEEGVGSVFTVYLPVNPAASQAGREPEPVATTQVMPDPEQAVKQREPAGQSTQSDDELALVASGTFERPVSGSG